MAKEVLTHKEGDKYMTTVNKNKFVDAMKKCNGIIYKACEKCGISRGTYYKWFNDDPEFASKMTEISESCVDMAEDSLMNQIQNGNVVATIFYLKTKGRQRGYIENVDVNTNVKIEKHITIDDARSKIRSLMSDCMDIDDAVIVEPKRLADDGERDD